MAALFISHSSADDQVARAIGSRLRDAGHQSLFLDCDPGAGIVAGRTWEHELYAALRACDVVVFLGTGAACASHWCFAELSLARSLGRTVIGVMLEADCHHPLLDDSQVVRWHVDPAEGWTRLLAGLHDAQLVPHDSFDWNPNRPPYPGLDAFHGEDAGVFFGRRAEIAALRQLLEPSIDTRTRLVIVTGPSGSGKSSLVHAGLLPRIARSPERWTLLGPLTPGADPLGALAREVVRTGLAAGKQKPWTVIEAAFRKAPRRIIEFSREILLRAPSRPRSMLLAVDQFEELITRSGERDREDFLRVLRAAVTEAASPIWVTATVRSEFLTPLLASGALAGLSPQVLLVGPLDRRSLPEVIEGPARRAAMVLEDGLAAQMVEDCAGEDALPLLAYVLRQLYERAGRDRRLQLRDYQALGGVEGAVRDQADRVFDSLADRFSRDAVLRTLVATVTLGVDYEPMRRRVERRALGNEPNQIVDAFIAARLYKSSVEAGQPVVEVAHETLLRTWPPLREAVVRARKELKLGGELDRAAQDWERAERRESYLWSGERLAAGLKYADAAPVVDPAVRSFLSESARRDQATMERQAELIANQSLRECAADPERAILLALAAVERCSAVPRAILALTTAVSSSRLRGRTSDESLLDARVSPDGKLMLQLHRDENYFNEVIKGIDTTSGADLFTIDAYVGRIASLEFSADSRFFATGSDEGKATAWDARTGQPRFATQPVPSSWSREPNGKKRVLRWCGISVVALSDDGNLLSLFRDSREELELWNTKSGKRLWSKQVPSRVTTLVFAPDGACLRAGTAEGELLTVAVRSGKLSPGTRPHSGQIAAVAVSGQRTLTVSRDKTAVLSTSEQQTRLLGHEGALTSGAFADNGARVFTASDDGTVRCWDAETGDQLFVLRPHPKSVKRIMVRPHTALALTVCDGHLLRWETQSCDELCVIREAASALAFAPDGSGLVTGNEDGLLRIWDPATGALKQAWRTLGGDIESLSFSRDGSRLLAGLPAQAMLLDWPSGKRIRTVKGSNAALSPDGELVAVASVRYTAVLFNTATGKPALRLTNDYLDDADDDENEPATIAFSSDGTDIVTASADRLAAVWDISGESRFILEHGLRHPAWSPNGRCLGICRHEDALLMFDPPEGPTVVLKGHERGITALTFSPDGRYVLTAGFDATARLWDVQSGELLRVIRGCRDRIERAVFSPDARLIAVASDDGTVRVWRNLDLADWIALARERVFRDLTSEEQTQYGLGS